MGIRNRSKDTEAPRRGASSGRRIFRNDQRSAVMPPREMPVDPDFDAACEALVSSQSRPLQTHRLQIVAQEESPLAAADEYQAEPPAESTESRARIEQLEAELAGLRHNAALHESQVELLRRALAERDAQISEYQDHITETGREGEPEELRTARREIEALRAARSQLQAMRQAEAEQLSEATRREMDSRHEIESLRATVAKLQAARQDDNERIDATLSESSRREQAQERELEFLRRALVQETADHEVNVAEFRAALSTHQDIVDGHREVTARHELEAQALSRSILQRDIEIEGLREDLARQEAEAAERAEELRRALLESEQKRTADAEEFLALLARRGEQASA